MRLALLWMVPLAWVVGCSARGSSGQASEAEQVVMDAGAVRAAPAVGDSGGAGGSMPAGAGGRAASATSVASGGSSAGSVANASAGAGAGAGAGVAGVAGMGGSSGSDSAGAGGASTAGVPQSDGPAMDPAISEAIAGIDAMRVGTAIETLAAFTTRNTCSDNTSSGNQIGAARDWIQTQFQAAPQLTVSLQDFPARCSGGSGMAQNVVAVKLGAHPERVFVIGGHYDSLSGNGSDPAARSPGANDSGSQTAALLEVARALAPLELDATVLVAAFAGEEQGLWGSAQLAKDYAMFVVPNAKVEAMFNMDIVGGDNSVNNEVTLQQFRLFAPGTPREMNTRMGSTDDTSPARGVMRYIDHWGKVYVPSMTMVPNLREDRPGRGGDHQSFNNAGIPAVRFIETEESPNAGTNASHQHSPNDLPMYVTPSYTARIAQIVSAVTASLARAPMAPKVEGATLAAAGAVTMTWSAPASGPAVDHYVIAARPTTETFYQTRVVVPASATSQQLTAAELGLTAGATFFISVAAADAAGHESLFGYPEYRCDTSTCAIQAGSLEVTARN